MAKYKLTNEQGLFRIQALVDIPSQNVKAGDLGGLVASEGNLSQEGTCWIYDNAIVSGNAIVSDNARVYDNAHVYDNAIVSDNARVHGNAIVSGSTRVSGKARVSGNAIVTGSTRVSGKARVSGNARVSDNARVSGNTIISGKAIVSDNARVSGNARVSDNAEISASSDYITIYPIGSEGGCLTAFKTKQGISVNRGCFSGTLDEFAEAVAETHGNNKYAKQYQLAVELIKFSLGE